MLTKVAVLVALILALILALVDPFTAPAAGAAPVTVTVQRREQRSFVSRSLDFWRWRGHTINVRVEARRPKCSPAGADQIRVCRKRIPGAVIAFYDFDKRVAYVEWWKSWVICHEVGHGLGYLHSDPEIWRCPGTPRIN